MIITIRNAKDVDKSAWLKLRQLLWPKAAKEEHLEEIDGYIVNPEKYALLASLANGTIVDFLEMSLRHEYVEGCKTSPVAYLEGIFVLGEHRNKGVAKLLVKQADEWAINAGCTEIASDAEITNAGSIEMHKRLGFEEINRVVHFVKRATEL